MAPINEIEIWLTKKEPYSYGLELLSTVFKNHRLLSNLARKENAKNLDKVVYELKKYLRNNTDNEDSKQIQRIYPKESTRVDIDKKPKSNTQSPNIRAEKELSPVLSTNRNLDFSSDHSHILSSVKEKRVLLYRERGHLHGGMHEALSENSRLSFAKKIMKLQSEIDAINTDMKLVEKGETPRSIILKMMSGKQYKEYLNAQNYVVRYKGYLKKSDLSSEQIKNYQGKLKQYENKVESYF